MGKKQESKFYNDTLNCIIRKLLEKNNITNKEFAKRLNISTEAVRLWNAGYSRPDICKLPEIAKFFNVSIDYLLGESASISREYTNQMALKKFSLSDKSMNNLSKLTLDKKISSKADLKLKIINYIIEDSTLMDDLTTKLVNYYKANDNKFKIKDEIEEKCGISTLELTRYSVIKVFEQFIDDSYEQLWHRKKSTLFDMPKSKIKRNEE